MSGTAPSTPMLQLRGLHIAFGARLAVRGIDLDLYAGRALAIVGPSGAGKSATSKALLGLHGAEATVAIDSLLLRGEGQDAVELRSASGRGWRRVRGSRIGFVSQDALTGLDPLRTIGRELDEAIGGLPGTGRAGRRARAVELLARAGLPEGERFLDRRADQLSGGQRQRALIATAIARDPAVVIADEPTASLDPATRGEVLALLRALVTEAGVALLLVSHDDVAVAAVADEVRELREGRLGAGRAVSAWLAERRTVVPPVHQEARSVPAVAAALVAAAAQPPRERPRTQALAELPGAGRQPDDAPAGAPTEEHDAHAVPCSTERDTHAVPGTAEHETRTAPSTAEPDTRSTVPHTASSTAKRNTRAAPSTAERDGARIESRPATTPTRQTATLLTASGLRKSFRTPDGAVVEAVAEASLELFPGETVGLVGPSGSGKSTLARLLLGLEQPEAGSIVVAGRPWSPGPERLRRSLRHRIGHVPQDALSSFDPRRTVGAILADAISRGASRSARRHVSAVAHALAEVELPLELAARRPLHLSGGQRQRVAIARALAAQPAILLCDEAVSALDPDTRERVLALLARLQAGRGLAMLFIAHDHEVVARVSHRILRMEAGRLGAAEPAGAPASE